MFKSKNTQNSLLTATIIYMGLVFTCMGGLISTQLCQLIMYFISGGYSEMVMFFQITSKMIIILMICTIIFVIPLFVTLYRLSKEMTAKDKQEKD